MTSNARIDESRRAALARIDSSVRWFKITLFAAALSEAGLLAAALSLIDMNNRLHLLMFALTGLTYLTLALGMIALGAHVSRCSARVLAALELVASHGADG